MKIEIDTEVSFNLSDNEGVNAPVTPYILTIWNDGNEIVILLDKREYENLRKEII